MDSSAVTPKSRGLWSYETTVMLILGITFGIAFIDRAASSPLAVYIQPDLHLTNAQVGLLGGIMSLTWAVFAYVMGRWSDSTGVRKPFLIAFVLVFSCCSFLSGLAPNFTILILSRLVMGAAEGPFLPVALAVMASVSSPGRRGLNAGLMQNLFSGLLGSVAGPIVVIAIAKALGWRAAFYLVGAPGLLCALLIALFVREPSRKPPTELPTPSPEDSVAPPPADTRNLGLLEMLRIRNVWLCCVIGIFLGGWLLLNGVFLPLYFTKVRHLSPTTMSLLLAAMGAAGAFYGFLAPTLSDRFGRKPIMVIFSAIAVIAPLSALFFSGPLPILALLLFAGFTGNGLFPLFMGTIPGEALPPRYAATAMGLIVCVTEIFGGFTMSFVAGRVADATSLAAPSFMAIGCAVAASLLSLGLKESAPTRIAPARQPQTAAA